MRRSLKLALIPVFLLEFFLLSAPAPALAQADPATQRLIDQLRFNNATRGMVRPQSGAIPAEPAPSASVAPAALQRAPAPVPTVRAELARPSTTAPAGVPAVSITVNFASGSAALSPAATGQLASLGRALTSADLSPFRFRIEGHTDTVGSAQENLALSERRANAVRDFLVERFYMAPERLVTEGAGESRPLVMTPDEVSNSQNRRVQVLNLGS